MKGINFSEKEFIELITKVFLPILIIVVIVGIVLWLYSKHAEKKGIKNYNNKINFHASLISIVVTLILLAITVIFSVDFLNVMKSGNLIESNKITFYIVILSPIIPFLFLIYLITRLVKSIPDNNEEVQTSKIENNENIEKDETDETNKIEDITENKKENPEQTSSKKDEEEIELL